MKRMTGGAALAALLGMLSGVAIFPAMAQSGLRPPLVFSDGFEKGSIDKKLWSVSGNAPTVTDAVSREGKYAMKTVLNRLTSPKSYRTEVTNAQSVTSVPGGEYWYGFSIYLPSSFVPDTIWEIVAQWHSRPDSPVEDGLNPPVSLHTENGEWSVSTIWDTRTITPHDATHKKYTGQHTYRLGKYQTGVWTDWVFHIRWSYKSDGLLQVWKDGKMVINKSGPIGFNQKRGPYFKIGLYKGWRSRTTPVGLVTSRTLYEDAIRIAGADGSYDAVAPGIAAKLSPSAPQDLKVLNDAAEGGKSAGADP